MAQVKATNSVSYQPSTISLTLLHTPLSKRSHLVYIWLTPSALPYLPTTHSQSYSLDAKHENSLLKTCQPLS